jgi:nucleoside phosphorylase
MTLLVFAHSMEATVFITKLKLKKENISLSNVYSGPEYILVVTGQGIANVISKLTNIITIYGESILQIKNFGIAGRLDPQLKINKCYEINSVIMNDRKYVLDQAADGVSCITSHEVVSSEPVAERLLQTAQAVDMELWSVADVAASFKIPVRAVKLISDDARQTISLHEVMKNVKFYSEKLFDYFNKHQ